VPIKLASLSVYDITMRCVTCVRTGEVGVVGGVDEIVVEGLVHVIVLVQVDHIQYVLTHQVLH